jgi:hypothetical protein
MRRKWYNVQVFAINLHALSPLEILLVEVRSRVMRVAWKHAGSLSVAEIR